jgi:hypothetical protein
VHEVYEIFHKLKDGASTFFVFFNFIFGANYRYTNTLHRILSVSARRGFTAVTRNESRTGHEESPPIVAAASPDFMSNVFTSAHSRVGLSG